MEVWVGSPRDWQPYDRPEQVWMQTSLFCEFLKMLSVGGLVFLKI